MLAEKLGMTVARLRAEMANDEFHQWRAFRAVRAAEQARAESKAGVKAKVHRGRRR